MRQILLVVTLSDDVEEYFTDVRKNAAHGLRFELALEQRLRMGIKGRLNDQQAAELRSLEAGIQVVEASLPRHHGCDGCSSVLPEDEPITYTLISAEGQLMGSWYCHFCLEDIDSGVAFDRAGIRRMTPEEVTAFTHRRA